jgi:hypothetical protein
MFAYLTMIPQLQVYIMSNGRMINLMGHGRLVSRPAVKVLSQHMLKRLRKTKNIPRTIRYLPNKNEGCTSFDSEFAVPKLSNYTC